MPTRLPPDTTSLKCTCRCSAARLFLATALTGYTVALVTATHLPTVSGIVRYPGIDKVLHLFAYWLLASLAAALTAAWHGMKPRSMLVLALLLAVFAGLDELTQPIFSRRAEFADWIADCFGIIAGVGCVILLCRLSTGRARHKKTKHD